MGKRESFAPSETQIGRKLKIWLATIFLANVEIAVSQSPLANNKVLPFFLIQFSF